MKTYMYIILALVVTNIALGVAHAEEQEPINLERTYWLSAIAATKDVAFDELKEIPFKMVSGVEPMLSNLFGVPSISSLGIASLYETRRNNALVSDVEKHGLKLHKLLARLEWFREDWKTYLRSPHSELNDHYDKGEYTESEYDAIVDETYKKIDRLDTMIADLNDQIRNNEQRVSEVLDSIYCVGICNSSGSKEIK